MHASRPCWASSRSGCYGSGSAPCETPHRSIQLSQRSNLSSFQSSPLSDLLPPSHLSLLPFSLHRLITNLALINHKAAAIPITFMPCRTTTALPTQLQHRHRRSSHLYPARRRRPRHLRRHRADTPLLPPILGQLPRSHGHHPRLYPVLPADLHNPTPAARGEPQHPNDVHPDARRLPVGGESGSAVGKGRVEHLGFVRGDGNAAGDAAGDGGVF